MKSSEIIQRIENRTGWSRTKIAKDIFRISLNNLGNRVRDGRLNLYLLIEWASHNNVNLDWLLTGKETSGGTEETTKLDPVLLKEIIEGIESYLVEIKKTLPPATKARLIALLYDHYAETQENVDRRKVVSYLKLVA